MYKSQKIRGAGLVILVILVLLVTLWGNISYASSPSSAQIISSGLTPIPAGALAPNPPSSGRPSMKPQGSLAITPPVTDASVRRYITENVVGGGVKAQTVAISAVQFLTVANLKMLLNENDPFWDAFGANEPMVYVTLTGDFTVEGPEETNVTYHSFYKVFSVTTGNELGGGAR